MKERRAQKEHERYERRRGERQPRRSAAQQNEMTAWERRCANESAVASGIAIAKPRGQAPHGFPVWDSHFGVWTREVGGLSNGLRDESEWRAPKQKFPKPAGSAQCKRGRPIDPSSRHQQKVQRRAAAQRRVLEQQVAQLGLEDELAVKQHEFIEHCEANARELTQAIRVLGSQGSVALYDHLTDHGADITTSDMQRVIARVESGGDVHWTDLHGSGAACGATAAFLDLFVAIVAPPFGLTQRGLRSLPYHSDSQPSRHVQPARKHTVADALAVTLSSG